MLKCNNSQDNQLAYHSVQTYTSINQMRLAAWFSVSLWLSKLAFMA